MQEPNSTFQIVQMASNKWVQCEDSESEDAASKVSRRMCKAASSKSSGKSEKLRLLQKKREIIKKQAELFLQKCDLNRRKFVLEQMKIDIQLELVQASEQMFDSFNGFMRDPFRIRSDNHQSGGPGVISKPQPSRNPLVDNVSLARQQVPRNQRSEIQSGGTRVMPKSQSCVLLVGNVSVAGQRASRNLISDIESGGTGVMPKPHPSRDLLVDDVLAARQQVPLNQSGGTGVMPKSQQSCVSLVDNVSIARQQVPQNQSGGTGVMPKPRQSCVSLVDNVSVARQQVPQNQSGGTGVMPKPRQSCGSLVDNVSVARQRVPQNQSGGTGVMPKPQQSCVSLVENVSIAMQQVSQNQSGGTSVILKPRQSYVLLVDNVSVARQQVPQIQSGGAGVISKSRQLFDQLVDKGPVAGQHVKRNQRGATAPGTCVKGNHINTASGSDAPLCISISIEQRPRKVDKFSGAVLDSSSSMTHFDDMYGSKVSDFRTKQHNLVYERTGQTKDAKAYGNDGQPTFYNLLCYDQKAADFSNTLLVKVIAKKLAGMGQEYDESREFPKRFGYSTLHIELKQDEERLVGGRLYENG